MTNGSSQIVQKLWNYCNVLRDDGLSYGDYVEQLTYFLFLKMAHEQTLPPWKKPSIIPKGYDWSALDSRDGDASKPTTATPSKPWANRVGCWGSFSGRPRTRSRTPRS